MYGDWIDIESGTKGRYAEEPLKAGQRIVELSLNSQREVRDEQMEALESLPHLTYLELDYTNITDAGAVHIRFCQKLRILSFREVSITDESVGTIASLDELQELDLWGTEVTDKGVTMLAQLPKLEALWLHQTAVTDEGIAAFYGKQSLKKIGLGRTQVTAEAKKRLRESIPGLKILPDDSEFQFAKPTQQGSSDPPSPDPHEEPSKEELLDALREDPSNSWALYNLGLMNYLAEDYSDAIESWKTLKNLEPSDWQVREKLIQAYWGASEKEAANREIAELREARKSGKHEELNEKGFFMCDQFPIGKARVFVIEYYELTGDRPLAWKFLLKSGEEYLDHYFSVGSYASTTGGARNRGEIAPDERRYHLDGYWNDGTHATYGFYRDRPDYQEIRNQIRQILEGEREPLSWSTPQASEGDGGAADPPPTAPESKPEAAEKPESKTEECPR